MTLVLVSLLAGYAQACMPSCPQNLCKKVAGGYRCLGSHADKTSSNTTSSPSLPAPTSTAPARTPTNGPCNAFDCPQGTACEEEQGVPMCLSLLPCGAARCPAQLLFCDEDAVAGPMCLPPPSCVHNTSTPLPRTITSFCCSTHGLLCPEAGPQGCISAALLGFASDHLAAECCNRYGVGCVNQPSCWDTQRLEEDETLREVCCEEEGVSCALDCARDDLTAESMDWCCEHNGVQCGDAEEQREEDAESFAEYVEDGGSVRTYIMKMRASQTLLQSVLGDPKQVLRRLRFSLIATSEELSASPGSLYVTRLGVVNNASVSGVSLYIPRTWNIDLHVREVQDLQQYKSDLAELEANQTDTGFFSSMGESEPAGVVFAEIVFADDSPKSTASMAASVRAALKLAEDGSGVFATTAMGYGTVIDPVGGLMETAEDWAGSSRSASTSGSSSADDEDTNTKVLSWELLATVLAAAVAACFFGTASYFVFTRRSRCGHIADNASTETMMVPPSIRSEPDDEAYYKMDDNNADVSIHLVE